MGLFTYLYFIKTEEYRQSPSRLYQYGCTMEIMISDSSRFVDKDSDNSISLPMNELHIILPHI